MRSGATKCFQKYRNVITIQYENIYNFLIKVNQLAEMSVNMDKLNSEKAVLVGEKVKVQESLANHDNLKGKLVALTKDFEEKKAELAKKQDSIQDINNKICSDKEISQKFKSFIGQKKSLLSEQEDVRFALLTAEVSVISITF